MATCPVLIFCCAGNRPLTTIAVASGFRHGAQLPDTVYTDVAPLYFADQNWKRPNRTAYMEALAKHRPTQATVLDLEREDQLDEVLNWAEEAAQHVSQVTIVPKVCGIIQHLPHTIAGAQIILGYSVPTRYAGTEVPVWEFAGWPVHLLGGSPRAQMRLVHYLNVTSADGNFASRMATRLCAFWTPTPVPAKNKHWPTLSEADGRPWDGDTPAYIEAFRRSCTSIAAAWHKLYGGEP